jgi:hypothetical protein
VFGYCKGAGNLVPRSKLDEELSTFPGDLVLVVQIEERRRELCLGVASSREEFGLVFDHAWERERGAMKGFRYESLRETDGHFETWGEINFQRPAIILNSHST